MRRSLLIPIFLLFLTGWAIFWVGTVWLRSQADISDFTSDTGILQTVVGNDVLDIPANYTRIASQRRGETANRLDLIMLWPDGSGYTDERASLFKGEARRSNRVFVTLSKREMSLDMTGRLNTVYREIFDGPVQETGTDLVLQRLREGTGYSGEVLAISKDRSWVARCETDLEDAIATCLRDVHMGQSLTVRYRFSRELLDNWREIESLVRGRIDGFLIK